MVERSWRIETEWMSWMVATMLGGCVVEQGGSDSGGESGYGAEGSSETTGTSGGGTGGYSSSIGTTDVTVTGASVSATASATGGSGEPGTASATVTTGCLDCSASDDGGSMGALESCGVEYEAAPLENFYSCACETCSVDYQHVTPATGNAIIDACTCICDAIDCGGSVSGGVTTQEGNDTGDTDTGNDGGYASTGGGEGTTTGASTTASSTTATSGA